MTSQNVVQQLSTPRVWFYLNIFLFRLQHSFPSIKFLPRPPDFEPQIGPGFYDSKNSSEEKLINAFKITEAVGGLLTDYKH